MSKATPHRIRARSWRLPYSLLLLAVVLVAALLEAHFPAAYAIAIQEDSLVEWTTFWAFLGASVAALSATRTAPTRWFMVYAVGLGLGCLLIAMEEISWGQRVFGYRPPELFLAENAQQELNLHNLVPTDLRKTALVMLLVGFGVVFPLAGRVAPLRRWLANATIPLPSLLMVPAFLGMATLYLWYPWRSTGEWVELLAGMGFLWAALELRSPGAALSGSQAAVAWCAPLLLGLVAWVIPVMPESAERIELAQVESKALAADFRDGRLRSRCGVHKRLYTFMSEYGATSLDEGAFAGLAATDAARRRYFLDPWNLAYWIRHTCSADRQRRAVFVYSFGPNGRRDSMAYELAGDDVGYDVYAD